MYFRHSPRIWSAYPQLVAGVVAAGGVGAQGAVRPAVDRLTALAAARLAAGPESGLAEIQAWRRAYATMGLPPTRYRCAAESLLRRFRREAALPRLHPLVDLCNAFSLAYAIPVGVFDVARIDGDLEVRHALGDEDYLTFAGTTERPDPDEVIFADRAGRAHSRRWTGRQSGDSAVRAGTGEVLIVVEGLHADAPGDVPRLVAELVTELERAWPAHTRSAVLSASAPSFRYAG
ncbi:phenylalanine--tRNA ligase beta subunit-related protein [Micromonospora sp. NPDC050686]|uniref:B3/B4 domain-containing protein n=1 Tax=Micromonospora sp. NPDC050686 TaxID=3154631 RepID=UPI0033F022EE